MSHADVDILSARLITMILTVVALGFTAFLPNRLPGQWHLFQRYSVFVYLGVIAVISWAIPESLKKWARAAVLIMACSSTVLWCNYFAGFMKQADGLFHVLHSSSELKGKSLAAVIGDNEYRGQPVLAHCQNYHMIWNHGLVPTSAAQFRFRFLDKVEPNVPPDHAVLRSPSHDDIANLLVLYREFDWLLVRGPFVLQEIMRTGHYTLVQEESGWVLLHRLVPVKTRDTAAAGRVFECETLQSAEPIDLLPYYTS